MQQKKIHKIRKYPLGTEIIMLILAAIWVIPIYYLVVTTFKSPQEATDRPLGIPLEWHFENYVNAFQKMEYPRALCNTLFITVVTVTFVVILGAMAGYALARSNRKINAKIFLLFLAGLTVPFQMNIISLYKILINLKLMNKFAGVILVDISLSLPQAIFLFREFVNASVPREIDEAADLDGCTPMRKFFTVVLPLLKPIVATDMILCTLSVWNDFMMPLLLLQHRKKSVLLLEVYRNIGQFSINWTSLFPMLMLAVLPLLIFYVIMQKHIISGVAAGAVKG